MKKIVSIILFSSQFKCLTFLFTMLQNTGLFSNLLLSFSVVIDVTEPFVF
jgi:hypothetical protein